MSNSAMLVKVCAYGFVLGASIPLDAATIMSVESFAVFNNGTQPGCLSGSFCESALFAASGVSSITTISPNNDEVSTGNQNLVTEDFWFSLPLEYIVTFRATNSGGVTEYLFEDLIGNEFDFVGLPITRHRITLQTDQAVTQDQLDFDTPDKDPAPTSAFFLSIDMHEDDLIEWTGLIGKTESRTITYSLDVPDCGVSTGITCSLDSNSYSFTMRHIVNPIPVPPAIWLFCSGLISLIGIVRRKQG